MNLRDILTFFDYNYWANHQILMASAHLSPEQFVGTSAHSFGSLRGTLVHILDSESAWRMLLQHNTLDYFDAMHEEDFTIFESLEQRWQEEELAMRDYLVHLTDTDL